MSKKKNVGDILLTTTENLADELLFKTANTFLEDAIKSIPFASIITSSIQNYAKCRTFKEQKQLLAFIQEAESTDNEFIERFFNEKSNTELGFEILGILDQTYLEKQARMIFRATKLFKDTQITKHEFDKFTYIITKLNNHLMNLIDEIYLISDDFQNNPQSTNHPDIKIGTKLQTTFPSPNMNLISFGFLKEESQPTSIGADIYPPTKYTRTKFFYDFYENIFKD